MVAHDHVQSGRNFAAPIAYLYIFACSVSAGCMLLHAPVVEQKAKRAGPAANRTDIPESNTMRPCHGLACMRACMRRAWTQVS